MPPLIIPSTWEVRLDGSFVNRPWTIVLHVMSGVLTLTQSFTDTISNTIQGALTAAGGFTEKASNQWNWATTTVTDIRTAGAPQFVKNVDQDGATALVPLPPDAAAVVTWRTDLRSRRGRGRSYFNGLTVGWLTGGRIDAAFRTALELSADKMFADLDTAGVPLGVTSRVDAVTREVTRADVDDVVDRQNRRGFD